MTARAEKSEKSEKRFDSETIKSMRLTLQDYIKVWDMIESQPKSKGSKNINQLMADLNTLVKA